MRKASPVLIVAFAVAWIAPAVNLAGASEGHGHWGYEGKHGPSHWGDLDPSYSLAKTGQEQSPVDIESSVGAGLPDLAFDYAPSQIRIRNNGHTIQVDYDAGSALVVDGNRYDLLQFHFHSPSEHTIDGKHADLEGHLVHKSAAGVLAVVGVMIREGESSGTGSTSSTSNWTGARSSRAATSPSERYTRRDTLQDRRHSSSTNRPCSRGTRCSGEASAERWPPATPRSRISGTRSWTC